MKRDSVIRVFFDIRKVERYEKSHQMVLRYRFCQYDWSMGGIYVDADSVIYMHQSG